MSSEQMQHRRVTIHAAVSATLEEGAERVKVTAPTDRDSESAIRAIGKSRSCDPFEAYRYLE